MRRETRVKSRLYYSPDAYPVRIKRPGRYVMYRLGGASTFSCQMTRKFGPAAGLPSGSGTPRIVAGAIRQVKENSDLRHSHTGREKAPPEELGRRCVSAIFAIGSAPPPKWTRRHKRYSFKSPRPVDCSPPSRPPRRPRLV